MKTKKPGLKPGVWKNKDTGNHVFARRWWSPLKESDGEFPVSKDEIHVNLEPVVLVGWLICNLHGVWFGVNRGVTKHFTQVEVILDHTEFEKRIKKEIRAAKASRSKKVKKKSTAKK